MQETTSYSDYKDGLMKGIPIGLGYLSVSFTFGFMAVANGLPIWLVAFMSLSNLTSAGQFAGTNLILAGAGNLEIALTTFIINIRYMLMSLALSQKIKEGTKMRSRLIFAHGITDEIFAVAAVEKKKITPQYMYGLMTIPIIGWTSGTILGGSLSGMLPASIQNAMGIALYGMFIAIILPPAKKSKPIVGAIALGILSTCILEFVPVFSGISAGFKVIIATFISAGVMAAIAPIKEGDEQEERNEVQADESSC